MIDSRHQGINANLYLLQEEYETEPILERHDVQEIQAFYQRFYKQNIEGGEYTKRP